MHRFIALTVVRHLTLFLSHYVFYSKQLPDKSIASLVKYYYSWKKTRARTSLMDVVGENRNANTSSGGKRESGGSEPGGSDKESDNDEKVSTKLFHSVFYCILYYYEYYK